MVVPELAHAAVAPPGVGVHDRAGGGRGLDERAQRVPGGVLEDRQAQASRAAAADLDGDPDERLLAALAAARKAFLVAAQEELVDLDLALERLALGGDHRATQLVQHRPRRLMTAEPELTLQLPGRDPRMKRRDQIRRPKPRAQRQARAVHHRPRRHRRLQPTTGTDPQMPTGLGARARPAASRTHEPLRPPRTEQILTARRLGREALLKLQHRQREVWTRHPAKLRNHPDGANPVRTCGVLHAIKEMAGHSSPRSWARSRIHATTSSYVASLAATRSTMPPSASMSGGPHPMPLASRNRAVRRNAARLLASGRGWFLARCWSSTAAYSTSVGYASVPPNDAKGACRADSASASRGSA